MNNSDSSAKMPSFISPLDVAPDTRANNADPTNTIPLVVTYWRLVRREYRRLLIPVVGFALIALLIGLRTTPIYEATSSLTFESTKGPVSIQEVGGGIANVSAEEGLAEFLQTSDVALRVIRSLNLTARPEFVENAPVQQAINRVKSRWLSKSEPLKVTDLEARALTYFQANLKVARMHLSPLVRISFQSEDPEVAAAVVNEVPVAFIRADMDARYAATREADQWLNERLTQLKSNLDRSELTLNQYRSVNGIVARDADEASARQISMLNQRLIDARARLASAEDAQRQANSPDFARVMAAPGVANNQAVSRAREAESAAQAQLAQLRGQLGTAHPQYRKVQDELKQAQDELRRQVGAARQEIAAELEAARAHESGLSKALEKARQASQNLDSKEIMARQLEQDVTTNRHLYQTFLGRVKEVTAAGDFVRPPARLVDAAQVPTKPIKPRLTLMTLMGAALGLVLGFFGIVLMDQVRHTLRRTDDVESRLGRTLLSSLPKLDPALAGRAARMQINRPNSLFAESIRTLATAVALQGMERRVNVIAVSSAMEGEGKTAVACNLAAAFASTRRVLLIDADLRQPSVAGSLGINPPSPGLANLLMQQATVDQCIRSVRSSTLKVLPAGRAVDNALDLLMNTRFDDLISMMRSEYDVIIIDCPPIQLVSDALVLGRRTDSMVFVARSDSTPLQSIRRAINRIDKAGISLLGVVLNAHDFELADRFYGENSGYGRYGYGTSYGGNRHGEGGRRTRRRSSTDDDSDSGTKGALS